MKSNKQNISRRTILKSGLAACAGICSLETSDFAFAASDKLAKGAEEVKMAKRQLPVGLQLWSVRTECARDFAGAIAAVAKMGYEGVEFAGYYENKAQDVRKMLDDNGLRCCGTHTNLDTLTGDNLAKTIEFNKVIGNKYLIVPALDNKKLTTKEAWLDTAKVFNKIAEKTKDAGMRVGFHNHWWDLKEIDGKKQLDILLDNTSKDVIMQLDTYHVMRGGGDPVDYLNRYPGRALTIHLKEYSATNEKALVGEGDVKWQEIFEVCESTGGTQWYIIEEESGEYPPLEAVETSLKNYRKLRSRQA